MIMVLGSDLCGCLWDRVSAQACLGWHPARNSLCTMCVTCLSSLCDWFSLNNIKGARPERSGRFGFRPKKVNIEPCALAALYCVLRESFTVRHGSQELISVICYLFSKRALCSLWGVVVRCGHTNFHGWSKWSANSSMSRVICVLEEVWLAAYSYSSWAFPHNLSPPEDMMLVRKTLPVVEG